MNFEFEDNELMECQKEFNRMGDEERLFLTHYELAKETKITDSQRWKRFLTDTRVAEWINQEVTLYKSIQLRKMIKNADSNDRSYGAAQMINALNKSLETDTTKDGAMFVYMYVPLNDREKQAPNIMMGTEDIFERRE